MQTRRNAPEAPVPSRRTACRQAPPSLRSTPCQSERGPTAPPCRMQQVTTTGNKSPVLWLSFEHKPHKEAEVLHWTPSRSVARVTDVDPLRSQTEWTTSSAGIPTDVQWSGNSDSASVLHMSTPCWTFGHRQGRYQHPLWTIVSDEVIIVSFIQVFL